VKTVATPLDGVLIIEPRAFGDSRGFFMESWKSGRYEEAGIPPAMVQSNFSRSARGVLRGLHYQYPQPQGKLISVVEGAIFDVAVDIRHDSATFGHWTGIELSAENRLQLYVPEGFAHGFCALSDSALVHYLCTTEYVPEHDATLAWNDPDIGIDWPMEPAELSAKDAAAPCLKDIPVSGLPGLME
jgi:dTDP-4-dehydrorhamnose 3,5-epimerase